MLHFVINLSKMKIAFVCILIIAVTAAALPAVNYVMTSAAPSGVRLPVLMYHHVLDNPKKLNKYTISSEEFENDLKYIAQNGYETIGVKNLTDYCEKGSALPKKPIMITFDDGYESVYTYAYPLLKKYKMRAVINVIGRYADLYSECNDHNINYSHITWKQLEEISKDGTFEVENHTYDMHKIGKRKGIGKMSGESHEHYCSEVGGDIAKMQSRTKQMLGEYPTAFAYPFGNITKDALPVIKSTGIKVVFCCWEKMNYITGDAEQLYHINRFNRPHGKSTAEFFGATEKL